MKQTLTFLLGLLCSVAAWSQDYVIENGVLTSWLNPSGAITIPNEVTSIAPSVFQNNTAITEVNTNEVTIVGEYAFDGCTNLTEISMPKVKTIGQRVFRSCNKLITVDMPVVETVGAVAFHGCNGLTTVTFSDKLVSFGGGALSNCALLSSIVVDENNPLFVAEGGVLYDKNKTTIWAYGRAVTASSYTAPESVTKIGNLAFFGNTYLTTVSLPSVTTIYDRAFYGCNKLSSVSMPKVVTIEYQAFCSCAALSGTFNLPDGLKSCMGSVFNGCYKISGFAINADNTYFSVVDGVLFNKNKETLVAYPCGKVVDDYTFPASVIKVDANAFSGNRYLKTVNATSLGLTTLGAYAFENSALLESLNLPSSLNTIGEYAFANCPKLVNINFAEGSNFVVEDGVIFNSSKTQLILYPKSKIGDSYTVPESVVTIANSAFYNTSLVTVDMPNVVTVNSIAFNNCLKLTTVNMPNVTNVLSSAFYNCSKLNSVSMPKVTRIYGTAFYGCKALVNLSLPSVKRIDASAFDLCSGLTSVDCSLATSLTYLGIKPFMPENGNLTVWVSTSVVKSMFPATVSRKYKVVVKTYAISIASPIANGSVAAVENGTAFTGGNLEINKEVVFTATPAHNYAVEKWTVNGTKVDVGNVFNYTVAEDAEIGVAFVEKPDDQQTYQLDYGVVTNSLLTSNGGGLSCSVDAVATASGSLVLFNKAVDFTATPGVGYRVHSWLVDGVDVIGNKTNSFTHLIPKMNSKVEVTYEVTTYTLNYDIVSAEGADENGTLVAKVDDQLVLSGNDVAHGKTVVYTATPDVGYKIKQWMVDGVVVGSAKDVTMEDVTSAHDVSVEFELKSYAVSYAVDGANGTLSAKDDNVSFVSDALVGHGSHVVFTAVPANGYRLKEWMLNNVKQSETGNVFNVDNLTGDVAVSVSFEVIPLYDVEYGVLNNIGGFLSAVANEQAFVSGSDIADGSAVVFTAVPLVGFEVDEWSVNGESVDLLLEYSFTLKNAMSVSVSFKKKSFVVVYAAGSNGSIEGAASQSVKYGEASEGVTAKANAGYKFLSWSDGSVENPRIDSDVAADLNVTATFGLSTDCGAAKLAGVVVSPNPFADVVRVDGSSDIVRVSIVDAAGHTLITLSNDGQEAIVIPTDALTTGFYVLVAESNLGEVKIVKLMKR